MLRSIIDLYRQSWRYALACPILFLVPVAAEAAQHVAEVAQGFYDGIAGARAVEASPLRLGFGLIKLLGVLMAGYWMIRWLAWGDRTRTGARDPGAEQAFAPLLAMEMLVQIAGLALIYGGAKPTLATALLAAIGPFLLAVLFADWQRCAPLGADGGPLSSIRLIAPVLPWALAFNLLAFLPSMIVHYGLGYWAIAGHGLLKWIVLGADTLVVGYLSAILSGVPWYISEYARARFERRLLIAHG